MLIRVCIFGKDSSSFICTCTSKSLSMNILFLIKKTCKKKCKKKPCFIFQTVLGNTAIVCYCLSLVLLLIFYVGAQLSYLVRWLCLEKIGSHSM